MIWLKKNMPPPSLINLDSNKQAPPYKGSWATSNAKVPHPGNGDVPPIAFPLSSPSTPNAVFSHQWGSLSLICLRPSQFYFISPTTQTMSLRKHEFQCISSHTPKRPAGQSNVPPAHSSIHEHDSCNLHLFWFSKNLYYKNPLITPPPIMTTQSFVFIFTPARLV